MRYLMTLALVTTLAIIAKPTVTLTRIWLPELMCRESPNVVLSDRTQADKLHEVCSKHTLANPEQVFGKNPGGYRRTTTVDVVAATPARVPDREHHPAPNPVDVPLSFNDPVYANAVTGNNRITLSSGSFRTDLSIVENSGEPTITCKGSCDLTRVRIQSREGVRCIDGNISLKWVYIMATGIDSDHADGVQCYSPGSTGTVTVKNSTFKMAGATTAGYFSADDWRGSHVFENVLFEGGSYGLRIPADGGSSVSLKNVYFVRGSFRYGPFMFDAIKGRRINITRWENIRWASWRGDQLVLGELIPRP